MKIFILFILLFVSANAYDKRLCNYHMKQISVVSKILTEKSKNKHDVTMDLKRIKYHYYQVVGFCKKETSNKIGKLMKKYNLL